MSKTILCRQLQSQLITPEDFQPYGQLITPSMDGKAYNESDAQLNLKNGVPRFYIMHLEKPGRKFSKITRHTQCTQCLGSLEGKAWLMAVCPPSASNQPELAKMSAFLIPGHCFIKLEVGTWHAGPHFDDEFIDFYNLELSDTNIVDHFTYNFLASLNLEFEIL